MSLSEFDFYDFGPFRLDVREKSLRRQGEEVPLTPKLYDLLSALVVNAGRTLEKGDLLREVWGETCVEEASLARSISRLRLSLDGGRGEQEFIKTVSRRGYRLVAEVTPGRHMPPTATGRPEQPGIVAGNPDSEGSRAPDLHVPASPAGAPVASRIRWGWMAVAAATTLGVVAWFLSGHASPAGTIRSLAVLPFGTGMPPDQANLGLGLTDALITRLARAQNLTVRPTSAVLRYEHRPADVREVSRTLGVDAVLGGTARESQDRVRVSVQLVHADGRPLWAGQFDEPRADLFRLESKVAARVAEVLGLQLRQGRVTQSANAVHPEAHDAFLRGRMLMVRLTEQGLSRAIEHFTRAVELEPQYAQAYAGLAMAHINTVDLIATPAVAFPSARAAAQRALAIDDTLADAHAMLGIIAMQFDWDWPAAERHYRTAIHLDPNLALAHIYYAWLLALTGRFPESRQEVEVARGIDPLSFDVATTSALVPYYERDVPTAQARMRETVELYPDLWLAHALLGRSLELAGDLTSAIAEFERASRLEGGVPEALMDLGRAYAKAGRRDEARAMLARLDDRATTGHVAPFQRAMVYIGLGDRDEAFRCLNDAVAHRSFYLSWLKVEPMLDPLRDDPRYSTLLKRVGF